MEVTKFWSSVKPRDVIAEGLRQRRAHLWIQAVAAVSLSAAAVLAPDAAQAADTPSADTAASDTLADVIVTATRREQNLNDVPFSTTALSGDPLQTLGDAGDDIRQLAFKVPSLNIESSNGRAFPRFYIRGYGNSDYHDFASQPVGLIYDDIVQENPALKGFPIFDQSDVEVLRGPQGTLFGRNSPAGVVKLESAKPVIGETSGFFSISDGTYNSGVVQGAANVPVNDQMAFRISVQGQHRNDWVNDPVNLTTLGGFNDWAARAQLLYKPTDTFSALLNVHGRDLTGSSTLFRANIIQPGSNALIPGFDPAELYTDGPNSSNLQTVGANVHLTWSLPNLTLQSITGYESILHYLAIGDITGGCGEAFPPINSQCYATFPSGSGPGFIPFAVETSAGIKSHTQLTQEFRVVSANEGPLKGQAGVFIFYEDVIADDDDYCAVGECVATAPLFVLQDITRTKQRNDAEAIFGSLDYKVTDALTATAGLRYTADHRTMTSGFTDVVAPLFPPGNATTAPYYAGKSASNVSWDVSATYKLNPDTSVYARVATGFRAPTLGEPGAGIGIQVANAETTISYEAGIKADMFDRRARVAFDGYYFNVSNQQLSAVGGASNVTQLVNAEHTIGYGSELDFEAHPMPNLTFNVSGSLNITRIEDPSLVVAVGGGVPVGDALNPTYSLPGAFGPVYYARINGNPLPQAAKWVGDVSLRYDIPLEASGKLYVYTDWSYRSGINFFLYESKEFDGPSLTQGGVRLGYEWADGKYDAAVFCRNCTNEIRAIGGIDFADLLGYVNDPRIFGVQFRAKF
jgi:iron complex outermembrane receptor protein